MYLCVRGINFADSGYVFVWLFDPTQYGPWYCPERYCLRFYTFKEALWMKICPFMEIFLSAIMFLNVLLDTTLSDKVCQWLATGRWFFLCTLVFSNNKANHHDITELLLTEALNTITLPYHIYLYMYTQHFSFSCSNISSLL